MTDSETKHAIRMILITTSLGGMSYLSFNNGLLLAYFSFLGIPSSTILILLALLPLSQFVFMIPFSYLSDTYGKKLIGNFGMVLSIIGFFLMAIASVFPEEYRTLVVGLGTGVFGTGSALIIGNWFALLHPIIPENIRGRFFWSFTFDLAIDRYHFHFGGYLHFGAVSNSGNVSGSNWSHSDLDGVKDAILSTYSGVG